MTCNQPAAADGDTLSARTVPDLGRFPLKSS
jgi:hypothetical protein